EPTGFSVHRLFNRIFGRNKVQNQTYLINVPATVKIFKKGTDGVRVAGVFADLAVNQRLQIKGIRSQATKSSFTANQIFILNVVKTPVTSRSTTTISTACTVASDCGKCGERCIRKVAGQVINCPKEDVFSNKTCQCVNATCQAVAVKPEDEYCAKTGTDVKMSYKDALAIASVSTSACLKEGKLLEQHFCNEGGYWWIDFKPTTAHKGCNPACVVDIVNKTAEINWRCTGLNSTSTRSNKK
ncbi:MAG TPA: hypothetical protein PLX10_01585, partial [Candidatus Paceibacterota bacterium]|nr:hypothetical protein [Candidatus Paceibacterota bacterium]